MFVNCRNLTLILLIKLYRNFSRKVLNLIAYYHDSNGQYRSPLQQYQQPYAKYR